MKFHANPDTKPQAATPESTLLWTIRAWVIGQCRKVPVEPRIRDVFAGIAAPDAADALLEFMSVIGLGTLRGLNVGCVCASEIRADERLLLDIVALHQHHRHLEAMMSLRSILTPRNALVARDSAGRLAVALAASGNWLPLPHLPAVQHTAFAADDIGLSPAASATVH